jgi:YARHG domain-containing protein
MLGDIMKAQPLAVILFFVTCGSSFSQISATLDHPQCYENVGCPHKDRILEAQARDLSCQNLWLVRNTIFHQRGYCFQTIRGRAEFDNSRCSSTSISELRLSPVEKANVATLQKLERRKGCH